MKKLLSALFIILGGAITAFSQNEVLQTTLFNVPEKGRIIRIASSEATAHEKSEADFVCTGHNDQDIINAAFSELADNGGGKVILSTGRFFIDAFPHVSKIDHAAIELPNGKNVELRLSGDLLPYNGQNGTILYVRDEVYEALDPDTQYCVIRAGEVKSTINSRVSFLGDSFSISLPWNQKKIRCIDMLWVNKVYLQFISCYAYRSGYRGGWDISLKVPPAVAVEGCIGVRSTGGSNLGTMDDYRNMWAAGFHEGFQFAGEHLIGVNLTAVFNVYGYTFGNFPWTCGSNHPVTLINCCDERGVNLPLFAANGEWGYQEKFNHSGAQPITFIDFNIERIESYAPGGKLGDYAREVYPGTFRGAIEYTIQDIYSGHGNSVDKPFWEPGSGHGMKTRNQAQLQACDTKTRLSYAPNYLQHIWDTDLNKEVICIDPALKLWVDANGNKVDNK